MPQPSVVTFLICRLVSVGSRVSSLSLPSEAAARGGDPLCLHADGAVGKQLMLPACARLGDSPLREALRQATAWRGWGYRMLRLEGLLDSANRIYRIYRKKKLQVQEPKRSLWQGEKPLVPQLANER